MGTLDLIDHFADHFAPQQWPLSHPWLHLTAIWLTSANVQTSCCGHYPINHALDSTKQWPQLTLLCHLGGIPHLYTLATFIMTSTLSTAVNTLPDWPMRAHKCKYLFLDMPLDALKPMSGFILTNIDSPKGRVKANIAIVFITGKYVGFISLWRQQVGL